MVICEWPLGYYIHLWITLHGFKEQNGKIMAIWHRFGEAIPSRPSLKSISTKLNMSPFVAGWFRSFTADYGVPLMVVAWSALAFSIPGKVPSEIPRRLFSPLPWDSVSLEHWTVIKVKPRSLLFDFWISIIDDKVIGLSAISHKQILSSIQGK